MRPRFSVRLLLLTVALLAIGFYALFVRPTVVADRFVNLIEQGDYDAAYKFFWGASPQTFHEREPNQSVERVYAEVLPREWSDIWTFQRRILLRLHFHDDMGGRHVDWTEDSDIVVRIITTEIAVGPSGISGMRSPN